MLNLVKNNQKQGVLVAVIFISFHSSSFLFMKRAADVAAKATVKAASNPVVVQTVANTVNEYRGEISKVITEKLRSGELTETTAREMERVADSAQEAVLSRAYAELTSVEELVVASKPSVSQLTSSTEARSEVESVSEDINGSSQNSFSSDHLHKMVAGATAIATAVAAYPSVRDGTASILSDANALLSSTVVVDAENTGDEDPFGGQDAPN